MGGWGSGRQGRRVTIGGCGSYRLALKDLGLERYEPAFRESSILRRRSSGEGPSFAFYNGSGDKPSWDRAGWLSCRDRRA